MGTVLANTIYLKSAVKDLDIYFTDNNKELQDKVSTILEEKVETKQLDL